MLAFFVVYRNLKAQAFRNNYASITGASTDVIYLHRDQAPWNSSVGILFTLVRLSAVFAQLIEVLNCASEL